MSFKQPVVFLMGATATGKTELSLSVAEAINAEIISVDSALVYKGLDVGTAKPSTEETLRVPHHLIDICDPQDAYSTARFCDDAVVLIQQIQARGKRVLLVGGTMLYFKALEQGIADMPDADEAVRNHLVTEASAAGGWPAMHAMLSIVDPQAAERIHPNDPQRIQRALEVFRITGTPMSQLQRHTHSRLACPPVKFALIPESRAWLHERIERRFRQMLDDGFLSEVERLRQIPGLHADLPAMRSVGYRQAWDYLDHVDAGLDDDSSSTAWVDKAIAATRQLAKRQLTWLRGMDRVTSLSCDTLSVPEQHRALCAVLKKQEIAS